MLNRFNPLNKVFLKICAKIDPLKYAKKIGVHMGEDVHLYGNAYRMFGTEPWAITIGNHVHITDGVRFVNHDGGTLIFRHIVSDLEITKRISIGNYVYIGINSIVLPGVTIGDNCIIGAGSIVTHDVPSNSVVAGVPARFIKTSDDYFEKIKKESLHLGNLSSVEKDIALRKALGE